MKPHKPIKRRSAKGKRLDRLDKLQSRLLKIKRGSKCEICGRPGRCVFHILEKGTWPRLRYAEWNLLWTCWNYCHYPYHHYGPHHPKTRWIDNRIKELRGSNYHQDLKIQHAIHPKMTPMTLDMIEIALRQEIERLK